MLFILYIICMYIPLKHSSTVILFQIKARKIYHAHAHQFFLTTRITRMLFVRYSLVRGDSVSDRTTLISSSCALYVMRSCWTSCTMSVSHKNTHYFACAYKFNFELVKISRKLFTCILFCMCRTHVMSAESIHKTLITRR